MNVRNEGKFHREHKLHSFFFPNVLDVSVTQAGNITCLNLVHWYLTHNNFPITAISCHECSQVNTSCIGLPVFHMRFSLSESTPVNITDFEKEVRTWHCPRGKSV